MKRISLLITIMLVLFTISLIEAESQQWMHYGVEYSVRAQVEHEGTF